ncbi:MAG: prolyl oligopeptidase family serine peptidase, partial [Gemmatimonadota bacterium]|nr:prolyl oligopeptidase family serine peptidase [Gemmatimonadota bacterium]
LCVAAGALCAPLAAQAPRPMTFLDAQNLRTAAGTAVSPDGKWMLYTVSVPDWARARRQSDIYVVSTASGLPSTRRLTFTDDKNETSPKWARDGSFIAFLSDRDAAGGRGGGVAPAVGEGGGGANQLFIMRLDGGEARRITDVAGGVTNFSFSKDGKWLVYLSGRPGSAQLYAFAVADLGNDPAKAAQLTHHATGVGAAWEWSHDGRQIVFTSPDSVDRDERARRDARFTVDPRDPAASVQSLWSFDVATHAEKRLTNDAAYSVGDFTISPDDRWIGFHGQSPSRYERGILEQGDYADLYLLNVANGSIERLTKNEIIAEGPVSFSPNSQWLAFSAPDDWQFMHNQRVWLRRVDAAGGAYRKLGSDFDGDVRVGGGFGDGGAGMWSPGGDTIYFNAGRRATNNVFALVVSSGHVQQLTSYSASVSLSRDADAGTYLVSYADPKTPPATYAVASIAALTDRPSWTQLTDPNPWVRQQLTLGEESEITWKSKDGTPVSGVLVKPVGYQAGKKYPLIVAIHGGPAAADILGFNGGYNAQVYAGAGYVVLEPNYRQSTNYGQKFKIESQGDYFTKGYQDIMAGVDHLIAQGMVDSTQMGVLGWSAGGHYSNWIETHTDRFKAISSGAGVANWISMWSQSDTHRLREWYLGDKMYWDDWAAWWRQSPIATIKNAKTPIFIHVVYGDPRVPRPQSEEMHYGLSALGVPNEFWVYPGNSHGIPDARNQYVKAVAEMAWMDYYVRGSGKPFQWRDVLKAVPASGAPAVAGETVP